MTSFISTLNVTTLFALFFFLSYSHTHKQPPHSIFTGLAAAADKTRMGSTPPSCHNKCNQCHPCTAVQVPTQPGHERVESGLVLDRGKEIDYFDTSPSPPSLAGSRYSNYKPLGWKCGCDGRFYNP